MRYRKKPVVIEAIRFRGNASALEILEWAGTPPISVDFYPEGSGSARALLVETLEGVMRAEIGDYIIRGVQGEFYPCKPDIFEATYEEVYE